MNTSTYRPARLTLTMLIAVFSALVALAVTGGHDAAAHGNGDGGCLACKRCCGKWREQQYHSQPGACGRG